ncbi:MAG: hypothetical protein ACF8PN_10285 [Phycisphaerales bacterium]
MTSSKRKRRGRFDRRLVIGLILLAFGAAVMNGCVYVEKSGHHHHRRHHHHYRCWR